MKIVAVERIVVQVPFTERQQTITARSVYNWGILELCKVTTDSGIVGWGETVIHYTHARVTDAAVERAIGSKAADLMWDDSLGAGLQMALFDAVGRALDVPCHKLMGNRCREWIPISWWSMEGSPAEWTAEAVEAVANGYNSLKLKQRSWRDIVAQVEAVAKAVPAHFKLDLDANGSLRDAASAMPVLRRLEQVANVAMFETPIPQQDILGNRQLRQAIGLPIAMHFGYPPYTTIIREEVCDGFVIGGGASQVVRNGLLSAEANMPFWLQLVGDGLTTTWAAHLGAVLTHATWPAITCINLFTDHLLKQRVQVVSGCHRVPEAPGLGVEVDEEAIARFAVPEEELRASAEKGEVYNTPIPRNIFTVRYADGSRLHTPALGSGMELEPYAPGTDTDTWPEDGSKEWTDMWNRIQDAPLRER